MSTKKSLYTAQTPTPQLTAPPHRSPGQPDAAKQPIPAARRQWAYRLRSKQAVIQAIGDETLASRVTLLSLLGNCLSSLDDAAATRKHPGATNAARRVISELVTRYDINLDE
jgi:hypothetical protein